MYLTTSLSNHTVPRAVSQMPNPHGSCPVEFISSIEARRFGQNFKMKSWRFLISGLLTVIKGSSMSVAVAPSQSRMRGPHFKPTTQFKRTYGPIVLYFVRVYFSNLRLTTRISPSQGKRAFLLQVSSGREQLDKRSELGDQRSIEKRYLPT